MRTSLHSCYILRRLPYRESSLLLEVFSRDYGRVSLVALGVRRPTRRRRTPLQLGQRLLLAWSGKSELKTLRRVEQDGTLTFLQGDACLAAFYLNELLLRLLHREDAHPELFNAYALALQDLYAGCKADGTLRTFELSLLRSLGYGLALERDAVTGAHIREDRNYYYQADRGPSLEYPGADCIRISGRTLCALSQNGIQCCPDRIRREGRHLLRYNLRHRLGERELGSRRLYQEFSRLSPCLPTRFAAVNRTKPASLA